MSKLCYPFIVLVFISCKEHNGTKESYEGQFSVESEISEAFNRVDSLLKIDNGSFWGKNLYGPVMIVEPKTRLLYSNQNINSNIALNEKSIYIDSLPNNISVANTSIEWQNKRWAQIQLPLPKYKTHQDILIIHELFHRLQPEIGFDNLLESNNTHLDSFHGRLLLKLELEALEKAILSTSQDDRVTFVKDALLFRNKRYKNKEVKLAENSLELNEGLAEYTALALSGLSENQTIEYLIKGKAEFYSNPTFVRSFAYYTIPMYGFILRKDYPNWHRDISEKSILSEYFIETLNLSFDTIQPIQKLKNIDKYSYSEIYDYERRREEKRVDRLDELYKTFTTSTVFTIHFHNMNISFNPNNVMPLENLGTYYPTLKINDDWGVLSVNQGAVISASWDKATVTKPLIITDTLIQGKGWKLQLDENWVLLKENGMHTLVKK